MLFFFLQAHNIPSLPEELDELFAGHIPGELYPSENEGDEDDEEEEEENPLVQV